jgi:hypothetical protein
MSQDWSEDFIPAIALGYIIILKLPSTPREDGMTGIFFGSLEFSNPEAEGRPGARPTCIDYVPRMESVKS